MRGIAAAITLVCLISAPRAIAQTGPTPDQLIDQLTSLDCPIPGASDTGTFGGFLGDEDSIKPNATMLVAQQGTLRYPAPCESSAIRQIIRNGLSAFPALIRHIDDKRPTKLVVGQDFSHQQAIFGGQFFAMEYQPRNLDQPRQSERSRRDCGDDINCLSNWRPFDTPYTVKVGDVCYALIGQIVDRHLSAVRYQPTMIVLVNSPIETPALADRVKADWGGVDAEGLKNALLTDLRVATLKNAPDAYTEKVVLDWLHSGALRRLRYYFPDTYAALSGTDLEKREVFEKAERAR
jgi:hypothetical protein